MKRGTELTKRERKRIIEKKLKRVNTVIQK